MKGVFQVEQWEKYPVEAPVEEPFCQQYFMERLKEIVQVKSMEYGRSLTACIKTFGCERF